VGTSSRSQDDLAAILEPLGFKICLYIEEKTTMYNTLNEEVISTTPLSSESILYRRHVPKLSIVVHIYIDKIKSYNIQLILFNMILVQLRLEISRALV
jgi:hypothetical protein